MGQFNPDAAACPAPSVDREIQQLCAPDGTTVLAVTVWNAAAAPGTPPTVEFYDAVGGPYTGDPESLGRCPGEKFDTTEEVACAAGVEVSRISFYDVTTIPPTLAATLWRDSTGAVIAAPAAATLGTCSAAQLNTLTGAVTEAAPASDTASSGLNGRLQRIAQRLTSLISLFPVSLGQKTAANSMAVVIASDQPAIPVQAGGYGATPSATFNRPADTNVYAIGDLFANSTTAGSVTRLSFAAARVAAGSGIIRRVMMTSGSTSLTNASYRLHLWTADPGAPSVGDNGVYVVQTIAGYLGYVDVTMSIVTADGSWGEGIPSFDKEFKLASGTTVYGQVEVRAARTPASGTTHTVSLDVIQD